MTEAPGWDSISLGFRELFRIVVPGAYAFGLLRHFLPTTGLTWIFTTTPGVIGAVFFVGILAYALHVHENVPVYKRYFSRIVVRLNQAVADAAGLNPKEDHRNFYKYFLESRVSPALRERIHYFSSFSYMLQELSFLSFVGAMAATVILVINICHRTHDFSHWLSISLLLLASFLFGNLGIAQWRAIIEQQCWLVRDLSQDMRTLAGAWQPK